MFMSTHTSWSRVFLAGLLALGLSGPVYSAEDEPAAGEPAAEEDAAKESDDKAAADEPAAEDAAKDDPFAVPDGTPEELLKFIASLKEIQPDVKSRQELIAHFKKMQDSTLIAADKILAGKPDDDQEGQALVAKLQSLWMLNNLGDPDKGEAALKMAAELLTDKRESVSGEARMYDTIGRMRNLKPGDAAAAEALIADTKALLEAKSEDPRMWNVAMAVAQTMEQAGHSELALSAYKDYGAIVGKIESQEAAQAVEQLEAAAAKLEMIGKPLDLEGTLVGGETLDWSAYKGKVVLVDFWATWCGPCIAELPNVKETYDKFHGLGFEVIGISLDDSDNREGLEKFLADEQIAWPIVFGATAEASGWQHPMARKYNINAIPAAILLNREGNVVTLSARGEVLPQMVEKLLGDPEPKPAAEAPAETPKPTKKPIKKAPATPKPKSE